MTATDIVNAAFTAKLRAGTFNGALATVRGWYDADDRRQEGIAQTWLYLRRHHDRTGELLCDSALVQLCRRRTRSRRDSFVPRRRGKWTLDVLTVRDRGLQDVSTDANPEHLACAPSVEQQLDLQRTLGDLTPSDRELAMRLAAGETTREVARDIETAHVPRWCGFHGL